MSLKVQALNGVRWTSISSLGKTIIQLVQLIILARYLEPTDFGLMAMATVVIGFSVMFVDMGVSGAIVHEQTVSHSQLSSLYWFNVGAGFLVFLAVLLLAPFVAEFYAEQELTAIIQILSVTFFVSAFGNQFKFLFQKNLKFNLMAKIDIVSALISFGVAVGTAMEGYGVYAFVYSALATSIVTAVAYLHFGLKIHRPSLIFRYGEITKMISFGAYRLGAMNLNYFTSQFDVILIGKLLGADALGIYSIAKNLSVRPMSILNPIVINVTFPIMSTIQDDNDRLKGVYLKTIHYLSSINFPVYIAMALLAEPLVLLLFGSKWMDSVVIVQILFISYMIRSAMNPMGSLQMAKGKTHMGFWWNLGLFFFIPLTVYIGSFWGIIGVAFAMLGLQVILTLPAWYFMINPLSGAGLKEFFWQMINPLMLTMIGAITAYAASSIADIRNIYLNAVLIAIVMGTSVFGLYYWYNRRFLEVVMELVKNKS